MWVVGLSEGNPSRVEGEVRGIMRGADFLCIDVVWGKMIDVVR
jgi:hypothetical protein